MMRIILLFLLFAFCVQENSFGQKKLFANRKVIDTNLVLPPAWAFGVLYGGYTDQLETIKRIEEIKKHNYPIDAYWIDSWFWSFNDKGKGPSKYIDFIADTINYPDRQAMWHYMQQNNIKGGFWTWDCILETGNETAFNDFKNKGFFKDIYLNTNSWHNGSRSTAMFQNGKEETGTQCGNIDFSNPAAVYYFKQQMKHFFDEGADFIKLDRTSDISTCKAMFEMSQEFGQETKGRGFILSHTGGMETEEYKRYPTKWTDDTRSDWTVEKPLISFNDWVPKVALKENIVMFTDPAKKTSTIPFLTNDLGGFDMGKTTIPEEELYIRWLQFSIFNPITEVFSQPENPTANLAWNYSDRADTIFHNYSHLRMQLFPYIYSYALRNRTEGKHMLGKFPEHMYQYTFGDEILVAPVYEKGAGTRKLFLPAGNWVNYWTGEIVNGGSDLIVAAPVEQIPLFIKQGSVIPMRSYASSIEKGDNKIITLHIYPGADGTFNLLEDDGISNDYLTGKYASTRIKLFEKKKKTNLLISKTEGFYNGMFTERTWNIVVHTTKSPDRITINRKPVTFGHDETGKALVFSTGPVSVNKKVLISIF